MVECHVPEYELLIAEAVRVTPLDLAGVSGKTPRQIILDERLEALDKAQVPEYRPAKGFATSSLPIGFTPIPNKRIGLAIVKAERGFLKDGVDPNKAHGLAVRQVAATLSPLPLAHRHRAPRPTKSEDPAYRKAQAA